MLTTLDIPEKEDTPKVILDAENGKFEISGRSLPEDAISMYAPIKEWLSEYVKTPNQSTEFICKIEYFNSSSAKKILELFALLEKIKDKDINIKWYYEKGDRLMETKGLELKSLLEIPFEVIAFD